jgi:epoxide hydrolase-like predicted phosphatase
VSFRAVYIDLGGVLARTEFQAPRQHLAERLGMEYEDIVRIVFDSESSVRASLGEITEAEHWAGIMRRLRRPVSEAESIQEEFFAGDVIDRNLFDFLRGLRETYKTGLISNAWSGLRPWIVRHKFNDAFDVMVISAEIGVMKPDPRIFQYALEQLDMTPSETVFIDDFPENVEAARLLGMHAIHFTNPRQAVSELKQLLASST